MALISKKKPIFKINKTLKEYLIRYNRYAKVPIHYPDLLRYENAIPLYDSLGNDTLWVTVFYSQTDMRTIYENLKHIYAILKAGGDESVIKHLYIDRVDLCIYGNTRPFRVRVVNEINDNFDYFYVKNADASRVYGLELEEVLSPNRVSYLVHGETLIEEHIAGIPGEQFIKEYLDDWRLNKIRLAKEFVKFNERCFVRLLGDMHSNNFVVDITPDFDEVSYRIRAIDFDQQSYEGKRSIYMPQYFKQNNPIIHVGLECMTPETTRQYQKEERVLIANRYRASKFKIRGILYAMKYDYISNQENTQKLKEELSQYYKNNAFMQCKNMGEILETSLNFTVLKVS
ncbi:hypothetical protein AAG747_18320 [Rapidithrix thailandica]|uniref:Uncharacterized protein n=1 Tax=Rapidithrix thailandica TaxID=413964 RepID=A0AAW9S1A2_9BACT